VWTGRREARQAPVMMEAEQYRAHLDAEISFTNGGGMTVHGFRLDLPRRDVPAGEMAALLVRHLGLLMVDEVRLTALDVVAEPHKGSRGVPVGGTAGRVVVDLSHPIESGMVTYPGLPAPEVGTHLSREASRRRYAPGTEFHIGTISMVGNTGTYLDAPYHRFADGVDLAGLPLERTADLPGVVVDASGSTRRGIGPLGLAPVEVAGLAVLLRTGWDRHWRSDRYGVDAPFLTGEGARELVARGAVLVGIDSVNIDDVGDRTRPAHTELLAAEVPVLEHLTRLDRLPSDGFRLHAAPLPVVGLGTVAVRAYAVLG
jgi:arylformamidase